MGDGLGESRGYAWVAIILAIGIATAINCITFAVLYDAIVSSESGLSENATQVLTAAFSGVFGVLGAYIGARAVAKGRDTGAVGPSEPRNGGETHGDSPNSTGTL